MSNWITVCRKDDLIPGTGLCALHEGEQVAIFRMAKNDAIYAVSNFDPLGEANVMSRGMTGSLGEALVVASPLYKHHFNLETGVCLEDEAAALKTYAVRVEGDVVQLQAS
jgi:nitrite reductase (NADH) small subunit